MPRLYDATGAVIGGECGVPDLYRGPCAWPHRKITYHEAMAFRDMTRADIARAYDLAWRQWADVCGIEPVRVEAAASANVAAYARRIGFRGGVLARSQFPCGLRETGRIWQHYDTAERWTFAFTVAVACHEIGHALGISHLGRGNLMYRSLSTITKPQPGDIAEAVARYGPPVARPDPQPWPGPPSPFPPPKPPEPVEPVTPEPEPEPQPEPPGYSAELARLLAPHRGGHVLAVDPKLEAMAQFIAQDNARRDRLSHVDASGKWPHERAPDFGVTNYHGEVLAAGGAPGVKAGGYDGWKQSPGHWKTITDPRARSIGVAMVEVDGGAWKYFDGKTRYWAAVTGT